MPNRILCNSKSIQSSSGSALYGRYLSKWVCLLQPARNNSQIHKLTKTLSHPSFTYNHMDDTSHCGQKVVENVNFLAHIPVTQYSFANLHFWRRWAFKEWGILCWVTRVPENRVFEQMGWSQLKQSFSSISPLYAVYGKIFTVGQEI